MNAERNDRLFSVSGEPPRIIPLCARASDGGRDDHGPEKHERFARIAADLARGMKLTAGQRAALENHGVALRRAGKLD